MNNLFEFNYTINEKNSLDVQYNIRQDLNYISNQIVGEMVFITQKFRESTWRDVMMTYPTWRDVYSCNLTWDSVFKS